MNYTFKTLLIPICLIFILGSQIFNYIRNQEVQIFLLAVVCFLIPNAIKNLKPEHDNSILDNILLIIGIIILVYGFYNW